MHRIFQIVRCRTVHIMVRIRIFRYVPEFGINLKSMEALINFQMCERTYINRLAYDSFRDFSKAQKPILNGYTGTHWASTPKLEYVFDFKTDLGDAGISIEKGQHHNRQRCRIKKDAISRPTGEFPFRSFLLIATIPEAFLSANHLIFPYR